MAGHGYRATEAAGIVPLTGNNGRVVAPVHSFALARLIFHSIEGDL